MAAIKLARLPERAPVKITILVTPDLHHRLRDYAAAYEDAYGQAETVQNLIPAILDAYLSSDRGYERGRRRQQEK